MYNYETEKAQLFTEDGIEMLLAIYNNTKKLVSSAGCCTIDKAISVGSGDNWTMLACIDFLEHTGKLKISRKVPCQDSIIYYCG